MPRRIISARDQVDMLSPWRTAAESEDTRRCEHQGTSEWPDYCVGCRRDKERTARRIEAAGVDLKWERDGGGNWILIGRNPDGNPVAIPTERAPSVRTSAIEFPYTRNNNGSRMHYPQDSEAFDMHVEPWGRYVAPTDTKEHTEELPSGWERGLVSFDNPLYVHEDNWKQNLSDQHGGATGKELSQKLLDAGHDGIVTHNDYGLSEMVDIRPKEQRRHRIEAAADDYHLQHTAPGPGETPIHDMASGVPEDWYTHPHYYAHGEVSDVERGRVQRMYNQARGNPDHPVTVYRALPPDHGHINTGDWVTPSLDYARGHAIQDDDPANDWPVISATVPAKHLWQDGNSYYEMGYHGPTTKGDRA